MKEIIVYLVPGLISSCICRYIGKEMSLEKAIIQTLLFSFIITFLNHLVLFLVDQNTTVSINSASVSFVLKYLILSIGWAVLIPFIWMKFLSKLRFGIEVNYDE